MDCRMESEVSGTVLGEPAGEGESPVHEGKSGGPPPKAKYYPVTDSVQYREGKVKRTPGGE